MKRISNLILIILLIPISLFSREYIIKQILPDVGYYNYPRQQNALKIIDLGNYYPKLIIPSPDNGDVYNTNVYSFTGDSFIFDKFIDSLKITDVGDFDNDGLPELLGYSIAYDGRFAVMEQPDTNQVYTVRTWESDSMLHGCVYLGSTNLLKTDGIDRIYGSDPQYTDDGWYYMSMNGDNSYYFDYELIEGREVYTMDIGYLDDDSLVDVIGATGKGQTWWEATNSNQDSFTMINGSLEGGVGTHYSGFIGDMDGDGLNEFIKGGLMFLMSPCMWGISIVEWKEDTVCTMIHRDTISKDYGFLENYYSGSDYDVGDIDGDGEDEFVWCAGCVLRVYEVTGDNSFECVWEMDNDTFCGSHVKVHDFNENGIDEIIWCGASDPQLPLTWDIHERFAYIIENAPISKLEYNNPYILDNVIVSILYEDSFYLKATDELPVIIDSLKLVNDSEITLNSISYPCSIPAYDSLFFDVDILINDIGYVTDKLIVYSNDWYGDIDTVILYAGAAVELRIDSAIASDNRSAQVGIDNDDYVRLYFNYPIFPPDTSTLNLDIILPLSDNHTWYDGTGNIKQINYTQNNTVMTIWLSTNTSIPTVLVGDSIYPDTSGIQDERLYSYLSNPVEITGSFDPTGIFNEYSRLSEVNQIKIKYTNSGTIFEISKENKMTNLTIYDILGKIIVEHQNINHHEYLLEKKLPIGVYFVSVEMKDQEIQRKFIIIK